MLKRLFDYHGGGRGSDFNSGGGVFSAGALISCLNGAVDSGLAEAAVTREQERLQQQQHDMRRCLPGGGRRRATDQNSGCYGSSDSDFSDDGQDKTSILLLKNIFDRHFSVNVCANCSHFLSTSTTPDYI